MSSKHVLKHLKRKAAWEVVSETYRAGETDLAEKMTDQLSGNGPGCWRGDCIELTQDELETVHSICKETFEKVNGPQRPYHQMEKALEAMERKDSNLRN